MRPWTRKFVSSDPADLGTSLAVPLQQIDVVVPAGTLSSSFECSPLDFTHVCNYSVTAMLSPSGSGGVTGSLHVQASNVPGYASPIGPTAFSQVSGSNAVLYTSMVGYGIPTGSWADVATVTIAASGAADTEVGFLNETLAGYKWVRLKWFHTAGTGSLDVWVTAKGDGI